MIHYETRMCETACGLSLNHLGPTTTDIADTDCPFCLVNLHEYVQNQLNSEEANLKRTMDRIINLKDDLRHLKGKIK